MCRHSPRRSYPYAHPERGFGSNEEKEARREESGEEWGGFYPPPCVDVCLTNLLNEKPE